MNSYLDSKGAKISYKCNRQHRTSILVIYFAVHWNDPTIEVHLITLTQANRIFGHYEALFRPVSCYVYADADDPTLTYLTKSFAIVSFDHPPRIEWKKIKLKLESNYHSYYAIADCTTTKECKHAPIQFRGHLRINECLFVIISISL